MTEPKKGPAEKRAVARAGAAEKRSKVRDAAAEERAAAGLDGALSRFATRIEASNKALASAMTQSLDFLREVLRDDQRTRRFWRSLLILALVLNFGLLGALGYNAVEGAKARSKLLDDNRQQEQTLQILKDATGPEAQAKGQAQLLEAFKQIDCNNQRAIQRAMLQLGHEYPLTEVCR